MPSFSSENTIVPMDGQYHVDPSNPMNMVKYLDAWYPPGVSEADILWGGNTAKLAQLADGTVLKYAWDRDDHRTKHCLDVEHAILSALGNHPRIVKYLGKHEYGLQFKLAANGDVRRYLTSHNASESSEELRRKWAKQAAEALAFIHDQGVIHSDIHPNNLLLDEHLDIQLCDFAGSLFGTLDGGAMESVRFFLPRALLATPDVKTDLFALGSTIYFLMSDREPYNDLAEEEVAARYSRMEFPDVQGYPCGRVIEGCWKGAFKGAQEVVDAILRFHDAAETE